MTKGQLLVLCVAVAIGVGCLFALYFVLEWVGEVMAVAVGVVAVGCAAGLGKAMQPMISADFLLACGMFVVREFLRLFLWWAIP